MSTEGPNPVRAVRGAATAPHALAAQSALAILREGGNALEAVIAAAATIAVAYPHMNSIGGDGFWLIARPGADPVTTLAQVDFERAEREIRSRLTPLP